MPSRAKDNLADSRTREGPRLVASNAGLRVDKIGKSFRRRPVVRGVSFEVNRGEAVGLLGPNGAGKTTVFYMITGLISPDYGTIGLDGVDITNLPMYRRARSGIGYLPQEASIFRGLTVEQNIRAVLEVVESDRARREAALKHVVKYGDPALRAQARPIDRFDDALVEEVRRMGHLMHDAYGIGLARRGWYGRDMDDLEYVVNRLYPEGVAHAAEAKVGP